MQAHFQLIYFLRCCKVGYRVIDPSLCLATRLCLRLLDGEGNGITADRVAAGAF